jgi:hypothetical protein
LTSPNITQQVYVILKMDVDVEQFLTDCKAKDVDFEPQFLNFLAEIDTQFAKIKEVYFKFLEIIEVDEIHSKDIERLHACLGEIEQIFNRLRSVIESQVEEFTLLEEMAAALEQIFIKVEYVYDLEQIGLRVFGGLQKDFLALDFENFQNAIEGLQLIISFRSDNKPPPYLPDTALEITGFCKIMGSLDRQFLPNVILLKLPPKLLQLYDSIQKITRRIRMFTSCVEDDYLSEDITNAIKSYNKIQKKSSSGLKDAIKIRGSSGLKINFLSLGDLAHSIRIHFLPLF